MKLRSHVNLIVGCLSAVFIVSLLAVELNRTRRAVHEEIAAANIVATRLLSNVAQRSGIEEVQSFLNRVGRIRANEVTLIAPDGSTVYQSPGATYKAGRQAPAWFEHWLLPRTPPHLVALADGAQLRVEANASRAILDGWDDSVRLLWVGGIVFVGINLLVFWLVGRAVAPLPVIASGLQRIEEGDWSHRLPALQGVEANAIGAAFNRMAESVQARWKAEAQLRERRELDAVIEERLHEERQLIARELHDEFAQSVTAIRTLAVVIGNNTSGEQRATEAAHLISAEAGRLYDAMHGLIPRLAPLALDTLSLTETLETFVSESRRRFPEIAFDLKHSIANEVTPSVSLAIYRIVQEGITNAVRHARARHVWISVQSTDGHIDARVEDDGIGLPAQPVEQGHFGLRGLRERVAKLDGSFKVSARTPQGVVVEATLPLGDAP